MKLARTSPPLPSHEVRATLQPLIVEDDYGTRRGLVAVARALAVEGESASRSW